MYLQKKIAAVAFGFFAMTGGARNYWQEAPDYNAECKAPVPLGRAKPR